MGGAAAQPAGTTAASPSAQVVPVSVPSLAEPDVDPEREVLVILRSGQRITGLLAAATDKTITIKVSGINASFPIADVERYEFLPPLMERYTELRAAVGDDPVQIADLAEWLRDRGRHELALAEIMRALVVSPEHGECLRLKVELEQQILLKSQSKTPAPPKPVPDAPANAGDTPGGGDAAPRTTRITDFPLLSPAQVDLMKVYEVDLADRPRLVIARETIARLMDDHAGHPLVPVTREGRDAMFRRNPAELLDLMFRLQARDLYAQVQVLDMPTSVRAFRESVHATWLLNSCATNMCHGGNDAGRLVLAHRRPNHDQTVYTNLFILQKYRTRDGRPLLDWENPEKSLLLQLALPREDSLFPHPQSPLGGAGRDGWKRVFRDTDDRLFEKSVQWIASVYKPRPEYPFPYVPMKPFEPPPAVKPAAAPAGGAGPDAGNGGGGGSDGGGGELPPR